MADFTPFARYRLLQRLASGGMGELFVALTPDDQLCVVKRMLAQHLDKPDFVRMFLAEARLLQWLRHPNIVEVLEVGEEDGQPFFAMELVRGRSLRTLIDELEATGKALPARHVVDIGLQLLHALDHAHRAADANGREMAIVHRDINPHNVLVSWDGRVKLIDFGIAKSDVSGFNTAVGTIKGKFAYMSPEQSAADPLDARSDLFSAAIVLYEALTLDNPFARSNVVLALEAIQLHPVPPPSSVRSDVAPMDDVLLRALEKNPDLRFPHAGAFAEALAARHDRLPEAPGPLPALLRVVFDREIRAEERRFAELGAEDLREDPPTDPGSAAVHRRAHLPTQPGLARPERPLVASSAFAVGAALSAPGPAPAESAPTPPASGFAPSAQAGALAPSATGRASSGPRALSANSTARAPTSSPVGRRERRPWLGYATLLIATTLLSFGLTRAFMKPTVAAVNGPLGTLRLESEPPIWLQAGGPNWVRTPAVLRIHASKGRLEIVVPRAGRTPLRAVADYRVEDGRIDLVSSEGLRLTEVDDGTDPSVARRFRLRVGDGAPFDGTLEWRPSSSMELGALPD